MQTMLDEKTTETAHEWAVTRMSGSLFLGEQIRSLENARSVMRGALA
jgi:hypothetical protein